MSALQKYKKEAQKAAEQICQKDSRIKELENALHNLNGAHLALIYVIMAPVNEHESAAMQLLEQKHPGLHETLRSGLWEAFKHAAEHWEPRG